MSRQIISELGKNIEECKEIKTNSHERLSILLDEFQKNATLRDVASISSEQENIDQTLLPPSMEYEMVLETFCNTFAKDGQASSRSFCEHLFNYLLLQETQMLKLASIDQNPASDEADHEDILFGSLDVEKGMSLSVAHEFTTIAKDGCQDINSGEEPVYQAEEQTHSNLSHIIGKGLITENHNVETGAFTTEFFKVNVEVFANQNSILSKFRFWIKYGIQGKFLSMNAFMNGILRFLELRAYDRIEFIIKIYDLDGDGFISIHDISHLVQSAFIESGLVVTPDRIEAALQSLKIAYESTIENNNFDRQLVRGLTYTQVRQVIGSCLEGDYERIIGGLFNHQATLKRDNIQVDNSLLNQIPNRAKSNAHGTSGTLVNYKKAMQLNSIRKNWLLSQWNSIRKWVLSQWKFGRPRLVWLSLYITTNILVFIVKFLLWKYSHNYISAQHSMVYGVCFAKALAGVATFNGGLIFFPVCRKCLSIFRDISPLKLWKWIPFNDNINFHILAGHVITIAGFGHTIAHVMIFRQYSQYDEAKWKQSPLYGKMNGPHPTYFDLARTLPGWTGHCMIAIALIAYPLAAWGRQKYFNSFWLTHQLFLVWTFLFMIHGMAHIFQPAQAVWFALPGFVIYIGERLQRHLCKAVCKVQVVHAETYDDTTVLYLKKPSFLLFDFQTPGCCASLNIGNLAYFEWHPFTISSAPGDRYLRFHIKRVGDWTTRLWNCVREEEKKAITLMRQANTSNEPNITMQSRTPRNRAPTLSRTLSYSKQTVTPNKRLGRRKKSNYGEDAMKKPLGALKEEIKSPQEVMRRLVIQNFPKVFIHGPFGAPSQDFLRYKIIMLVGAGIGVTPFASILRHILLNWRAHRCPKCQYVNHNSSKLEQEFVQFHWVTREYENLTWFSKELSELAKMDVEGRLEIHQHLTGVNLKQGSSFRQIVSNSHSLVSNEDVISGVKGSKHLTHFGRPDWQNYFKDLASKFPHQNVGVFYCGPVALQNVLQTTSQEMSKSKTGGGTKFSFYHEHF